MTTQTPRDLSTATDLGPSLGPGLDLDLGKPERRLSTFTGAGYDKGRSKLWQAAWFATMNLVFMKWWLPPRFRPAILRAFGAQVGERVLIRHRVRVLWPWKLSIGDDCWVGEGVWLLNLEPITIEHDVCLSQEAFLCTGSHRHRDPAFEFDNAPIIIGHGAWVAARATVLRGTTIHPGAVVAGGVVHRNKPGVRLA
jgi:putative colanic acid biosynthesis acetyltransferase WcaF